MYHRPQWALLIHHESRLSLLTLSKGPLKTEEEWFWPDQKAMARQMERQGQEGETIASKILNVPKA
jgi:hypothetical protein